MDLSNHDRLAESETRGLIGLDEEHFSSAYHCGRLLATCQHIQDLSSPGVKASYVARFFGGASTSPGTVLPRITEAAIQRLRRLNQEWLKEEIASMLCRIHEGIGSGIPCRLTIEEQGHFQLGYFHQQSQLPRADWKRARYLTCDGHVVKSVGEKTVAHVLHALHVPYDYELPAAIPNKPTEKPLKPDFTIKKDSGPVFFIEYLGMLGDARYKRQWEWKNDRYRVDFGVRTAEEIVLDHRSESYNLMTLTPDDIRSVPALKQRIMEVGRFIFGPEFPILESQH